MRAIENHGLRVIIKIIKRAYKSQCVERIFNKTAKAINETFAGLKLMLQGFRIYFFRNPSIKGIESTS